MNSFEKFLLFLNNLEMEKPTPFGWFHLIWISLVIILIIIIVLTKKSKNQKRLNIVLISYGLIALLLEVTKQIMWSFNYENGVVFWDYEWYAAPFQLCTTPIFVTLVAGFTRNKKLKEYMLSYLTFYTVISGLMVTLFPSTCFTNDIIVNIHTMFLHCMALVVSLYVIINKEVEINKNNLFKAFKVFIIFVSIALFLDVLVYNLGVLNGETFNMFYISPYFESTLVVFDSIYRHTPYPIFLLSYILILFIGSSLVYLILKLIERK